MSFMSWTAIIDTLIETSTSSPNEIHFNDNWNTDQMVRELVCRSDDLKRIKFVWMFFLSNR